MNRPREAERFVGRQAGAVEYFAKDRPLKQIHGTWNFLPPDFATAGASRDYSRPPRPVSCPLPPATRKATITVVRTLRGEPEHAADVGRHGTNPGACQSGERLSPVSPRALDELADEVGLPHLPYLDEMEPEIELD